MTKTRLLFQATVWTAEIPATVLRPEETTVIIQDTAEESPGHRATMRATPGLRKAALADKTRVLTTPDDSMRATGSYLVLSRDRLAEGFAPKPREKWCHLTTGAYSHLVLSLSLYCYRSGYQEDYSRTSSRVDTSYTGADASRGSGNWGDVMDREDRYADRRTDNR